MCFDLKITINSTNNSIQHFVSFQKKSQFCRISILYQFLAICFVIIIDCQRMKIIDSIFLSCIDKFMTSSRYKFVTIFTFYFANKIDFLIWSLMRFRWIFKIAIICQMIFFEKFFKFVFLSIHFKYLSRI